MMDIAEAQPREETLAHPPQSHVARPSQTRQTVLPPAAGLSGRSTPVYTFSQALSGDVNTVRPNSPPKAAVHHSGPKPGPLRIFLQGGGDGVRLQLPPQVGQHRSSRNPAQVRDGSAADNRTAPRSEDTKTIPREASHVDLVDGEAALMGRGSAEDNQIRRKSVIPPSAVESGGDENDSDYTSPEPPQVKLQEGKDMHEARESANKREAQLKAAGWLKVDDPCTVCLSAGIQCWRQAGKKQSGQGLVCHYCKKGKQRCHRPSELLDLSSGLGDLAAYFETEGSTDFPAAGSLVENSAIPETVGELLVALLSTVRYVKEGQLSLQEDIREQYNLMQDESTRRTEQAKVFAIALDDLSTGPPARRIMEAGHSFLQDIGKMVHTSAEQMQELKCAMEEQITATMTGMHRHMAELVYDLRTEMRDFVGQFKYWKVS